VSQDGASAAADALLAEASVLVIVGTGGVGKTTLTAALGVRAAQRHGRRVLVVTIDPARRLADALGTGPVSGSPVVVPIESGKGRLWASMVEMASSWDGLVRRLASTKDARALLANPLYRGLTRGFTQSHAYIALDHLCDMAEDDSYDLILIDTPPSTHAIDVLDAPDLMIEFFDSRLLRWLTAPYRSRLAQATSRPFLAVAERMLGGPFLARIAEFFWLFSKLQPGFVARAKEVKRRLRDPATGYVVITTSDPAAVDQTRLLLDGLTARRHEPSLVIQNRALPAPDAASLAAISDPSLLVAIEQLIDRDRGSGEVISSRLTSAAETLSVPWSDDELRSVADLAALLNRSITESGM